MAAFKGTVYFIEVATGRTVSYNISGDDVVNDFITFDELGNSALLPVPVNSGGFQLWDFQLGAAGAATTKLKVVIDGDQKRVNWRQAQLTNTTTDRLTRIGGNYPPVAPGSAFQVLQTA